MNALTTDRLYQLLPAIYRLRDTAEGEPLRALLAIIEQELQTLENDISGLYDDWFIETCAEWVVPYIGDLLDVRELYADNPLVYGQQEQRAYVANTLAYRRRKGTTAVLEQLTRDVTGWRSRAVEFARLVSTTQNLNHIRTSSTTASLRADNTLQQIGTPFEQQAAYSAEVRPVGRGGRYNTPNVGLFVWRLQSYPIARSRAKAVQGADAQITGRYYTFSPLGDEMPLFNQPQTETDIVTLSQEINVPGLLRRPVLAAELNERRRSLLEGKPLAGIRHFDQDPVLQIYINGLPQPIPPEEISIRSLEGEGDRPSAGPPWPNLDQEQAFPTPTVAVDPELGRIAFFTKTLPKQVDVSYLYGFSGDLGGGPYGRDESQNRAVSEIRNPDDPGDVKISPLVWQVAQATSADPNPLATAITAWNQTVEAWQGLQDQTLVALANITVLSIQVAQQEREKFRRRFRSGIVEGLNVICGDRNTEVMVTPGSAVDRQGRRIAIPKSQRFQLTLPDLSEASSYIRLLVLSHRAAQTGNQWQLDLLPETVIDGYPEGAFIPLARLKLNKSQLTEAPDLQVRSPFQPGIVQGLEVKVRPGTLETTLTAGSAVDRQGRTATLTCNWGVDLRSHQGQTRLLVLSREVGRQSWQIDLLPVEAVEANGERIYVQLALLDIPKVQIGPIQAPDRSETNPPQISGLTIVASPNQSQITVSSGTVTIGQRKLQLNRSYDFDLSSYAGRTLTLFISHRTQLGFPLSPTTKANDSDWQQLGIVPVMPESYDQARTGIIRIQDNQTYSGDLSITIPAARQLKILADNGYRPHIQGQVKVKGTAIATAPQPGELILDGLLIEKPVTILPGNLKSLQINHCTLVPQQSRLNVAPQPPSDCPDLDLEDDSMTLLALVLYCLALVWQSIRQDLGLVHATSKFSLVEITQRILRELMQLLKEVGRAIRQWCRSGQVCESEDFHGQPSQASQDNDRLEISLYRSICGPLQLTETVPKLNIVDSIVDKGHTRQEQVETNGVAIAAPGTEVEIQTSTVLGMTTVRSLEAGNSLFTEKVTALRRQVGCVRFSHIPEGSQTPRRYQCQPDLTFKSELDTLPEAITALVVTPSLSNALFAGTQGSGIFRWARPENSKAEGSSAEGSDPENSSVEESGSEVWEDVTQDLSNRHVTALVAYDRLDAGGATIPTVLAGTTDGNIFRSRANIADWTRIRTGANAAVTALVTAQRPTESNSELMLLAATAGGGVFRGDSNAENWEAFNLGLTNLNVTALAIAPTGKLFAGTAGDGVFEWVQGEETQGKEIQGEETQSEKDQSEKKSGDRWRPLSTDLTHLHITALTLDAENQLWAGTAGGGVFRLMDEENRWLPINQGLTHLDITALIASSHEDRQTLFAGTSDGKTFRLDSGQAWKTLSLDLQSLDITALVLNSDGHLFAGTVAGDVLRSLDQGDTWLSINAGLPNVAEKLLIMTRLQPDFTSTCYGDPGYAQLSQRCPIELRNGSEDGAEMGVFNFLKQPQREGNLQASLEEYLRFGLEAGIFYVT